MPCMRETQNKVGLTCDARHFPTLRLAVCAVGRWWSPQRSLSQSRLVRLHSHVSCPGVRWSTGVQDLHGQPDSARATWSQSMRCRIRRFSGCCNFHGATSADACGCYCRCGRFLVRSFVWQPQCCLQLLVLGLHARVAFIMLTLVLVVVTKICFEPTHTHTHANSKRFIPQACAVQLSIVKSLPLQSTLDEP